MIHEVSALAGSSRLSHLMLFTNMSSSIAQVCLPPGYAPRCVGRASADACCCDERSRNSENNTQKYPDIAASVPGLVKEGVQSVVLDCEAVAFERETGRILPFQVLLLLLCSMVTVPQDIQ